MENNKNIITVKPGEHPYIGETVTVKGTLSAFEGVTSKDIGDIVGNSDLMDEINELVLNDTRDAYIRELLNQNRELKDKIRKINGVVDDIDYVCDQYIENTTETDSVKMTESCALCVKVMLDSIRNIDDIEEVKNDSREN